VKTLLLIDQDSECRQSIRRLAQELGMKVMLGTQCLNDGANLFYEHPIDLVIMDVFHPEKSGLSFLSEMTSHPDHPPIIATFSVEESHGFNIEKFTHILGVAYTFQKPIQTFSFQCTLKNLLHSLNQETNDAMA
jgi:DNA-binding response OmpR family regulator